VALGRVEGGSSVEVPALAPAVASSLDAEMPPIVEPRPEPEEVQILDMQVDLRPRPRPVRPPQDDVVFLD
jgi:hypothetical protein